MIGIGRITTIYDQVGRDVDSTPHQQRQNFATQRHIIGCVSCRCISCHLWIYNPGKALQFWLKHEFILQWVKFTFTGWREIFSYALPILCWGFQAQDHNQTITAIQNSPNEFAIRNFNAVGDIYQCANAVVTVDYTSYCKTIERVSIARQLPKLSLIAICYGNLCSLMVLQ